MVKCQYEGIINGKELKAQKKAYSIDKEPFSWDVQPINGLKIGNLKSIHFKANGWSCYIGIKGGGKAFYNGHNFKLLLLPLSELFTTADFSVSNLITHGYHNEFWSPEKFSVKHLYQNDLEILLENHFDVFGLIDKGLAINKALNGK